nr:hypothetical protein [Tanacetum cinerariifolium]
MIRFKVNKKYIIHTLDMFRTAIELPTATAERPFIPPVDFPYIKEFLKILGYQGQLQRVSKFYVKNLAQLWQTMFKLGLAEAKSAKVYKAQQNVFLVENRILKADVEKLVEGDDESSGDEFADTMILSDEDSDDWIEHGSHKENSNEIVDDDDHTDYLLIKNQRTGSLESRYENMKTTIRLPYRSIRTDLSSNKAIAEELMGIIEKVNEALTQLATSTTKYVMKVNVLRYDAFYKRDHDDHPGDDAPQEGEKSTKRQKTSKSSKSARGSSLK